MLEKQLLTALKGIKKQCERHFNNCEDCPFYAQSYYGCEIRELVSQLDRYPRSWDEEILKRMLK